MKDLWRMILVLLGLVLVFVYSQYQQKKLDRDNYIAGYLKGCSDLKEEN